MAYIKLPDNSYFKVPEGASPQQAFVLAQEKYPSAFKPPEKPDTGFTGAFKSGVEGLKGDLARVAGKTGLMDVDEAEKYAKAQEEKQAQVFEPTTKGWLEAPLEKLKETAGSSLPYMAAPIAAAFGAEALGVGAVGAGLAAAVPSALQFTGSNLGAQMKGEPEEGVAGKSLKDTDLVKAGFTSIPQAAFDVVGLRYVPGVQKIFKSVGKEISEKTAKEMIEQGIAKTAGQYIVGGAKVAGIEGATEAGQDWFERLQAGLSLTSPKAREQYLDSFVGGAALGTVASPFSVAGKRAEARDVIQKAEDVRTEETFKKQQEEQAAKDAELQAKRQTPEYHDTLISDSNQIELQISSLRDLTKDKDLDKATKKEAGIKIKELEKELNEKVLELREIAPDRIKEIPSAKLTLEEVQQRKAEAVQQEQAKKQKELEQAQQQTGQLFGKKPKEGAALPKVLHPAEREQQRTALEQSLPEDQKFLTQIETKLNEAIKTGDTKTYSTLSKQHEELSNKITGDETRLKSLGGVPNTAVKTKTDLERQLKKLQTEFSNYDIESGAYDKKKLDSIVKRIDETQNSLQALEKMPTEQTSLFEGEKELTYPEYEKRTAEEQAKVAPLNKEAIEQEEAQNEIQESRGVADSYFKKPTLEELKTKLDTLRKEKSNLDKMGDNIPWYAKDRADELLGEIAQAEDRYKHEYSKQATGEKVTPEKYLQRKQQESLDDIQTHLDTLEENPDDAKAEQKANAAGRNYILHAIEEIDAIRKKNGQQVLNDGEVLTLVQELRYKINNVIKNRDVAALEYAELPTKVNLKSASVGEEAAKVGRLKGEFRNKYRKENRLEDLSPLEKELQAVKNKYGVAEEEFTLKPQYGKPVREEAPKDVSKVKQVGSYPTVNKDKSTIEETPVYEVTEPSALTPREKEAGKKVDVSNVGDINQGDLFADKALAEFQTATVRATPKNFMRLAAIQAQKFNAAKQEIEKKLQEIQRKLAEDKKKKLIDRDLLDQLAAQRSFVNDLLNIDEVVSNLKNNAAQLWSVRSKVVATIKEVDKLKKELKKTQEEVDALVKEQAEIKPQTPEEKQSGAERVKDIKKQIEEKRIRIAELTTSTADKTELVSLRKVLKHIDDTADERLKLIDSLHERVNELLNANVEAEIAILNGLETKYTKAVAVGEADAVELGKSLDAERAKQAKLNAEILNRIEEQVGEKRKAEQQQLEAKESLPGVRRTVVLNTRLTVAQESLVDTNKDIRTKKEQLENLKEGTKEYTALAREIAKLQADKLASLSPIQQKLTQNLEPLTKEEQAAKTKEESIEGARQMQVIRALSKKQLSVPDTEALIKSFRIQAELNRLRAADAKTKKQKNSLTSMAAGQAKRADDLQKKLDDHLYGQKLAAQGEINKSKPTPPKMKTGVKAPARKRKKKNVDLEQEARDIGVTRADFEAVVSGLAFEKKDVYFRVEPAHGGVGISQDEANQAISKIKVPKGLKLTVLSKLSGSLRDRIEELGYNPDEVRGGVLPDGSVFIVAENHADVKDLQRTMAHEITGHLGIETTIGEEGMKALANKVEKQEGGIMGLADKLGVGEDAQAAYAAAKRNGKTDEEANLMALRELIAHTEEARPDKGFLAKANEFIKAMVGAVRAALRKMGVDLDISTSDIYQLLRKARKEFKEMAPGAYKNENGDILFNINPKYNSKFSGIANETSEMVAMPKSTLSNLRANSSGLGWRTKLIDRFAPVEKITEKMKDPAKAMQLMYFLRMHDQRMTWVGEIASNGPVDLVEKTRKDGNKEMLIESKEGASLKKIAEALRGANVGNHEAAVEMFTKYLAAKRAKNKGVNVLDFSGKVTPEMLTKVLNAVNSDAKTKAAFEKAADIYNEYNRGLINFAVKAGAINKKEAAAMLAEKDYVPFYRVDKKTSEVFLDIKGAPSVKIGNLKDQPYLHELVGGDKPIMDVFTSALQNTSMLTDMALRNLAARNTAYSLNDLGYLTKAPTKGPGPAGPTIIHFKRDGDLYWAEVNSENAGIPSELLVKGLEGVNTSIPTIIKMLNIPSNFLRKWVVRNPAYAARQIVRDSLSAYILTGSNSTPVMSSLKETGKMLLGKSETEKSLQHRGILGGQVLTGTSEDQRKIMADIVSGKGKFSVNTLISGLDSLAIKGDASTRITLYNDFIRQGLSDMEATLATLESMNFSKRGTSPSLFMATQLIPFMNAQIQGLDVLYKAFAGKMPFEQKLQVRKKLYQRGLMLAGTSMVYAMMMSDDEAYINATDEDRLNNWFVYTPFSDEPIKVPIPFEVGLIFKAVPEALVNGANKNLDSKDTMRALAVQFAKQIPGASSYGLPQAFKPALETALNYSMYTDAPIDSQRLQGFEAAERYGDRTTELAKQIGKMFGISPNRLEYLIKGYTGSLPLAIASLTNPVLRSKEQEEVEAPIKRTSEQPIIGAFFQPIDGRRLIDKAYKDMEDINRTAKTYNKYEEEGRTKEADALLDAKADIIGLESAAGNFRKQMGELTTDERSIRSDPKLDPKEKRRLLDEIRQEKIALSKELSLSARE